MSDPYYDELLVKLRKIHAATPNKAWQETLLEAMERLCWKRQLDERIDKHLDETLPKGGERASFQLDKSLENPVTFTCYRCKGPIEHAFLANCPHCNAPDAPPSNFGMYLYEFRGD